MVAKRKKDEGTLGLLESTDAVLPERSEEVAGEIATDIAAELSAERFEESAEAAEILDELKDFDEPVAETLSVSVDLPAEVHSAPDHEVALAIEDTTVDPGGLGATTAVTTTSIPVLSAPVSFATESFAANESDPFPVGAFPSSIAASSTYASDIHEVSSRDDDQPLEHVYSRRDRLNGQVSMTPEPAAMLTADRLLTPRKMHRPAPEGGWPALVYAITLHLVNLGDSRKVRDYKAVSSRISKEFEGSTRFVPILTRKGGVGKTTITALIGMAMAEAREDRVIAIDANPDRGTLAERINKQTRSTVRDVVTRAPSIGGFTDFSTLVSRDETRLDILASDTDPLLSEAFDENDYNVVADITAHYYSIVLTDCGTGIVHSVMRATLQRADELVIVSGGSIDEARLASETLTWLEANGYGDLVRNSVVALNTSTQGTNLVKLEEIEAHFQSRVRAIVRVPYDPHLAAGSVINYKDLQPITRNAARELAALVADGLPARRPL